MLGGLVGLAAPKTAREERALGGARDAVVDSVQAAAQDVIQKVRRVADEIGEAAEKEARYQGLAAES